MLLEGGYSVEVWGKFFVWKFSGDRFVESAEKKLRHVFVWEISECLFAWEGQGWFVEMETSEVCTERRRAEVLWNKQRHGHVSRRCASTTYSVALQLVTKSALNIEKLLEGVLSKYKLSIYPA